MEKIMEALTANPGTKVKGAVLINFVQSSEKHIIRRLQDLGFATIDDIKPENWYDQQIWLNALKNLVATGIVTTRIVGQDIIKDLFSKNMLSPKGTNLTNVFNMLNLAYQKNHHGYAGYYKLIRCNLKEKVVEIEVNTPYPEEFDNGVLLELWRKYKPENATFNIKSTVEKTPEGLRIYMLTW